MLPVAQRMIKTLACHTTDALHLSKFVECLQFSPSLLKHVWARRFQYLGGADALFVYKRVVLCCSHPDLDIRLPAIRYLARFGVVKQLALRKYSVTYRGRSPSNSRVYWTREEDSSDFRLLPFDLLFEQAVRQIRLEQDPQMFQLLQFGLTTFLYNRYAMISGNVVAVASLASTNQAHYLGLVTAAVGYHGLLSRERQEDILRYYVQGEFPDRKQVLYALCSAIVELPQAARTMFQMIFNFLLMFNPTTKNVHSVISVILNLVEQGVASPSHFPLLINILLRFVDTRKYTGSSINAAYRAILSIFSLIEPPPKRAAVCASLLSTIAQFATKGCLLALAAADLLVCKTPLEGQRDLAPFDIPMLISLEPTTMPQSHSSSSSDSLSSSLLQTAPPQSPLHLHSHSQSQPQSNFHLHAHPHAQSPQAFAASPPPRVTVRRASGITRDVSALEIVALGYLGSPRAFHMTTPENARALRLLDLVQTHDTHKIAVVFVASDSTDDEMGILSATVGSPRYQKFLLALGKLIPLAGLPTECYSGGLDRTESASDGHYTLLWQDEITQVLFLVATLMPTLPGTVLNKKRHIGNCFVTLVYNESTSPFKPSSLPGQFNTAHIVITPLEGSVNRVDVLKNEGLTGKNFGPIRGTQVVSEEALPFLVRQTALEADVLAKELYHKDDFLPERAERMKQIRAIAEASKSSSILDQN